MTLLLLVTDGWHMTWSDRLRLCCTKVVENLLTHKADPYKFDHNGEFPLQQIVSEPRGTHRLLEAVLSYCTVDGMKERGLVPEGHPDLTTPLDCPVFEEQQRLILVAILNKRLDLAKSLVALGCSYWLPDKSGSSLFDFTRAVFQKDPVELELPDDKAMAIAAEENDVATIKKLIEYGTRPHFLDVNGMSPLMYACYTGSDTAVETLMAAVPEDERGSVANTSATQTGMFALILATYGMAGSKSKNQLPTVQALLRAAPSTELNSQLPNGSTALFMASQENIPGVVEELVSRKADPNLKTAKGVSPLYIAAHDGSEEIVKLLVKVPDIVIDPLNQRGATPLYIAVQKSFDPIIEMLLEAKANPNIVTGAGSTPLALAVHHCDFEVVRTLLDAKASVDETRHTHGNTEVIMAALSGHVDILKLLIDAGASLEIKNDDDQDVCTILEQIHGMSLDKALEMAAENEQLSKLSSEELHQLLESLGTGEEGSAAIAHVVFSLPASHPEFQLHIRDLFHDCDSDSDGNITREELVNFFARHAPELAQRYGENYELFIDEEFKRLDHDHDTTVSYKEFKACFGRLHQLIRRELNEPRFLDSGEPGKEQGESKAAAE